jgi:TetR/AcrR family transcriptional regulator, regulator of biofilm formation and stress response
MTDSDANLRNTLSIVRTQFPLRMQGMLDAAHRIVERDGIERLSLRAVARECGETTSLVLYYFGSMETLEALLVDSLWHSVDVNFIASLDSLPADVGSRIDLLVDFHSGIARKPEVYRVYADLVANVLRSNSIRRKVGDIYSAYREAINRPVLASAGLAEGEVEAYSGLVLGAGEGIPLNALISSNKQRLDREFALLSCLLKRRLAGTPVPSRMFDEPTLDAVEMPRPPRPPLPESPAAHRLISAGQALIRDTGIRSLSLDSISRCSGEARPAVGYYFGNKQGFIDRLVVETLHDWVQLFEDFADQRDVVCGPLLRETFLSPGSPVFTLVLVLPAIVRNRDLHSIATECCVYVQQRMARIFEHCTPGLSTSYSVISADLFTACLSGLALQHLYDPDGFGLDGALEAMCELGIGM